MPPALRKSTSNARSKKHVPYRHDDLQHGKRTGMAVDVVDRNSDDFEPFEKILSQADTRTPPRVKEKKRKGAVPSPVYEDENGEMSMDLASPITYFGHQRIRVPESLINSGSFSRASYLSPEVDFDEVPSRASVTAISTSRRRSSVKLNGKSPGSGLGRSMLSQSHLSVTPKTITGRKSRVERSPELPGDSDEDFSDGFEPPPTFEYPSRNALSYLSPEQVSFHEVSREEDERQATPEPVLPTHDSRQRAKDPSARTRESNKPPFLLDSEGEQPEAPASKQKQRRRSSKVSVAQVEPVQDEDEEEEAGDNPREDVEMDYTPPVEDLDSRRGRKLSSIMEALEPEEDDELEPMGFEQDAGPPDEPEQPPPISPPKKRGRKKISFDANSTDTQRPSKKPRFDRAPFTDKTSGPRFISIRPGKHSLTVTFLDSHVTTCSNWFS